GHTLRGTLAGHELGGTLAGNTVRSAWDLRQGYTVELVQGYSHGGQEQRVYQFIGDDRDGADLATEDYTTSDWLLIDKVKISTLVEGKSWTVVAPDGTTYILELNGNQLSARRNTINAVSVAASVGVGIGLGSAGIGIAGAGAVAQNVILTDVSAFGQN